MRAVITRNPAGAAASPNSRPASHCSSTFDNGGRHYPQEAYGQQNGESNVWGWLAQNNSSDQSVETLVGVAGDGWNASGSSSMEISTGDGTGTPRHGYSIRNYNQAIEVEYQQNCVTISGGHYSNLQWRATEDYGLDDHQVTESHPYYDHCIHKDAGHSDQAARGFHSIQSSAVDLYGYGLTTSSEWQSDVESNFLWVTHGEFCGDGSAGPAHSNNVEGVAY